MHDPQSKETEDSPPNHPHTSSEPNGHTKSENQTITKMQLILIVVALLSAMFLVALVSSSPHCLILDRQILISFHISGPNNHRNRCPQNFGSIPCN